MDDYEITYWSGVNNDQGEYITKEVKIEKYFVSQLFSEKPLKFLPFTDDEKSKTIISTDTIGQIKEV